MTKARRWSTSALMRGAVVAVAIAGVGLAAWASHSLTEQPQRAKAELRQCRFHGQAEPHGGMVWIPAGDELEQQCFTGLVRVGHQVDAALEGDGAFLHQALTQECTGGPCAFLCRLSEVIDEFSHGSAISC